ncbi:complex I subunit 5 family protein [Geomobilimonas luticola]|uniref:NADH:quinone oxidoreductase/Mrp antiporter transmembrane domain-containing protein n=1 Tax=Geomobilimonas luticola TaxID=1114878 RepID=A0ABS5S9G9_9BACT|nr:proton-conducting transporter membrane subunit [Geomobilimonas luticola]MBT0652020.1 hypothetical protein [Geomobilimonas luticola]
MIEHLSTPLVWLILLPLVWATLAFCLGPGRGALLGLSGLGLQLLCAILLAVEVAPKQTVTHLVGGWQEPLGILLVADGLSVTMLLLTQAVSLPVALYAYSYLKQGQHWFWPLTGFLLAGINGLYLSGDLFNLYVTLELIGLAAVGLVVTGGAAGQVTAAMRYLLASLVGSGGFLLGVALLYGCFGTVSIRLLTSLIGSQAPLAVWLAAAVMVAGLLLKTALFPFHFWLPPAHGGAPAPISALLSALVVKASFYVLLRLWLGPFAGFVSPLAWLPALLGSLAILWGGCQAIRAERLKMMVAYSTVAQLGYLVLIFPLFGTGSHAMQIGLLQATAHGLAKAGMFLAAGTLVKASGSELIDGIATMAGRLPVTLFAFGLSGVSLMGLPPSGGFLAKYMLIDAALAVGHIWIAVIVVTGGLLASIYVFRVLRLAFLGPGDERQVALQPVSAVMEWTAFMLAVSAIVLGLAAMPLFRLLEGVAG